MSKITVGNRGAHVRVAPLRAPRAQPRCRPMPNDIQIIATRLRNENAPICMDAKIEIQPAIHYICVRLFLRDALKIEKMKTLAG